MERGVRAPVRRAAVVPAVAILTIQWGDLPDEGDVAGVELVNNTGGKTAQDVLDDMGTQPVTSGSPPPWVSDMGGAAPVAPERSSAGSRRSTRENT